MYIKILKLITLCFILFLLFLNGVNSLPIIPGEKGFGIETTAGRGGEIYTVTNLNATGEGSLRDCINQVGPRICVFEISGTIHVQEDVIIENPYITIAGQTSPNKGITIAGAGVLVETHDVLLEHIRIRPGDDLSGPDPEDRDALSIGSDTVDVYNVIINHVTASWSIDEILSMWSYDARVYNVSVMNSIFSEALFDSHHPEGGHSMGVLIGKNTQNILLKDNIFAFNRARNPLIRDDSTDIILLNNLLYDLGTPSENKIAFGSRGVKNVPFRASVVGNVHIHNNEDTHMNTIFIDERSPTEFKLYLEDNIGPLREDDEWDIVVGRQETEIQVDSPPIWIENLRVKSSNEVKEYVLENAGARPTTRDDIDERIIRNIRDDSGVFIDSPAEVGGLSDLKREKINHVLPLYPHQDIDNDGYTNIEEWIYIHTNNVEREEAMLSNFIMYGVLSNETQENFLEGEENKTVSETSDENEITPVELGLVIVFIGVTLSIFTFALYFLFK